MHVPKGAHERRAGGCCRVFPWVPVGCLLLLIVGTPIWFFYLNAAASSTSSALEAASMDMSTIQSGLGTLSLVRLVVLALVIVTAVLVLLVAAAQAARKAGQYLRMTGGRPHALRAVLAADGFTSVMLWVLLLGAVVLLALTATWFLGSIAADMLLNTATSYSNTAEKAATRAVDSAQTLVEQLKMSQLTALDSAPQEVKDSQWFKDFRNGVNNFNQTVAAAANMPSSAGCTPGCISLDFLAGLAGLNSTCICLSNTITHVQQGLQATKQATTYALIGLFLVYLGTSWLLIHFVCDYTSTRRDLSEHKRLAKSSSSGDALFSPGRISPTADAAIDIRAADSPIGYKGPMTAAPRGNHHEYPCLHHVTADSSTTAPMMSRLPYV